MLPWAVVVGTLCAAKVIGVGIIAKAGGTGKLGIKKKKGCWDEGMRVLGLFGKCGVRKKMY